MEAQVAVNARTAFYQLRLVKQLVPYVVSHDLATVIHAMISSRLDYHNSLYIVLPLNLIQKLQLVQMVAACVLTTLPL